MAGEPPDEDGQGGVSLTPNALRILEARYLQRDESGRCIEEPQTLFRRVADAVAEAELCFNPAPNNRAAWARRFYRLMASLRFLPNSPTLMNAGRAMGMLSACFVLPVGDSIDEIFDAIKHAALIQKAGGGTGLTFDRLRPTGDFIRSSGGTTSGPISFWHAFCEASNAIQQGASRRGANMGMMYIHHPDILKFVEAKRDVSRFTNYNISVKIPDGWMEALRRTPDRPHVVVNPRTGKPYFIPRDLDVRDYALRSLAPIDEAGNASRYYSHRDTWNTIVHCAWQTGEPGVVFIDRINEHNPTPRLGTIEATNPCGEQPLLDYEACNLGSVNLARFVREAGSGRTEVDWEALGNAVDEGVRFLDNVIEVNRYPLPQTARVSTANRKIGLGVMGFADALFMLGVAYDSDEGVAWGERFMAFIDQRAHDGSERLAGERGVFPNWPGSTWDTTEHRPMRNACCTSIAPTGTISILAGCSAGIEPLFALAFRRHVLQERSGSDAAMVEFNPVFARALQRGGLASEQLTARVVREGSVARISALPEHIRRVYVTALDIAPEWHVRMQAAFQKYCDASVSKTINLPASATPEDVNRVFRLSYDLRCKGVTVYRDGCRPEQPMEMIGE